MTDKLGHFTLTAGQWAKARPAITGWAVHQRGEPGATARYPSALEAFLLIVGTLLGAGYRIERQTEHLDYSRTVHLRRQRKEYADFETVHLKPVMADDPADPAGEWLVLLSAHDRGLLMAAVEGFVGEGHAHGDHVVDFLRVYSKLAGIGREEILGGR